MSNNVLYARPSDNVTANATITASAGDGTYPSTNLKDLDPAKPAKLTTTSGNWVFDFGSAQRVDIFALIHHNLTAGLDVKIQGNATNVWTAPTLSAAVTIPAYLEDGFPVNPWLDLTAVSGYSTSGFRYWRLLVNGVNAANVAIGEVILAATKRQLEINVAWGAEDAEDHHLIEHRTAGGVVRAYDIGTKQRTFKGQIPDTTDVGVASLRSLHRAAHGRVKPFLIVPDPTINDAWMVRFDQPTANLARAMRMTDLNGLSVGFEELSRGLPL